MDATKVGVGALMLVVSGLTLAATGQPGAGVPLSLAGLASVGLVASVLVDDDGRHRLGR